MSQQVQQSQLVDVNDLFKTAVEEGNLSAAAAAIVTTPDFGAQIQAGLCPIPDKVEASEVMLMAMLIDDSPSILGIDGGPEAVCAGQNVVIDALIKSKQGQAGGILVGTWLMNQDKPVHAFLPLDQVERLKVGVNYYNHGYTPLYRSMCMVLATVAAEVEQWSKINVPCRAVVLDVTDGRDEDYAWDGKPFTAGDCRELITSMSERVIVHFMGVAGQVDFHEIARQMGIPEQWIHTPGNTESELRKAFQVASQSAARASQSAASFSQTAVGGFATS